MSLQSFLETYGYAALFVGTFLEGEVILVIAGFAAYQGYLELPWVIVTAFAGSLLGDQAWFLLGRHRGSRFLSRRPGLKPRVERATELIDRYRILMTLGFRFVYGLRTVTPFALGMSRIPTHLFVFLNAIAALIWSGVFGTGGFLFGGTLEALIGRVKRIEREAIAGIAAAWLAIALIRLARRRLGKHPS